MRTYNRGAAEAGKYDDMARAERHAKQVWKEQALEALIAVCFERETFIVDAVWEEFRRRTGTFADIGTHELRAMGPVLVGAAKLKICEQVPGVTRPSARVGCNGNRVQVWRSLII